ncbi:DeoR/GlpR family DNA-binding transcription regulator [Pedobacter africanus]|uniref:DeoR/GlpR family transcriptional regulator of sugar metabolism n=1 Tax=Pedobacter africanus TaxID=151894 RepID=A0ACC6KQM7_9SPHI|nr:DeoR/GlpR family DNA-binding transcription regulator [Pedobacter africanus]MDR6781645.1 DeoR/GlpR family transcriptional regulator of sugar metabolism [Pedobacter africanus]
MRKEERHKLIMREINLHNKVLSADLSTLLNISDDTVRRDLKELAETGKLLKVHGGAASKSFVLPFNTQNEVYALNEKKKIAEKTLKLIKNEMVILTEGGTTILELAKMIPENLKVTFFTISPQVAITLSDHSNLEVITIGGKLNKNANLHVGASVINQLVDIKVDLCLLGANAFSSEEGLTDMDWDIVQVKKAIIRSSKKTAVLSISEKLNTAQRIRICEPNHINYLITELSPESQLLAKYRNDNLKLL